MPKIKPLGSEDMKRIAIARQTNSAKADDAFEKSIDHLKVEMGITQAALADIIGLSEKTFRYRLKHKESFGLYELRILDSLSKQYGAGVSFL